MPPKMKSPGGINAEAPKIDLADTPIKPGNKRHRHNSQPIALARDFGFCHAVYIRDQGVESRAGLYADIGAAVAAAEMLNAVFAEAAT